MARRTDINTQVGLEFELYGSNFWQHGHNPSGCNVVVCWEDDHGGWPSHIEVIELRKLVQEHYPDLIIHRHPQREPQLWTEPRFEAAATADVMRFVRELQEQLSDHETLTLRFNGKGKHPTCNVCDSTAGSKIFWIWGDGKYQWCFDLLRRSRPDAADLLQRIVGS